MEAEITSFYRNILERIKRTETRKSARHTVIKLLHYSIFFINKSHDESDDDYDDVVN